MRYLYKVWIVGDNDEIIECPPLIAKDDVTASIKAIMQGSADPDHSHIVLRRLGEVPERDKDK